MTLDDGARQDLHWWMLNVFDCYRNINVGPVTKTIRSDASGDGWGITDMVTSSGGRWNEIERLRAEDNETRFVV